jgi:glycosyltransferase involved in cell wall biosynthesis
MVAECSDYKDYPTYIQAAKIVLESRRDVVFLAIGGGVNLDALRRLSAQCNESVRFIGERSDVDALVRLMYLGVLSSHTEGVSNAVMEYMAAGRPSVVTDVGGCGELVVDGRTGFLVPGRDATSMARRIQLLLDDPALARRLGDAARERLIDTFSLQRLVDNTLRVYRAVTGRSIPLPGCRS